MMRMLNGKFSVTSFAAIALTACANNPVIGNQVLGPIYQPYTAPVEIAIVSDNRGELPEYPVSSNQADYRAYVEALPNERYRVRVINNGRRRVGVVIAVDGRNIISGQPSWLRNTERMYILEPYGRGEYEGWRTGANRVNRFFFTEAGKSYAGAFGDYSAMGVIAAAVYAERRPEASMDNISGGYGIPQAPRHAESKAQAAPGTGYGETAHSPSQAVNFNPLPDPLRKVFIKYEWRSDLCAKRILTGCRNLEDNNSNRLWPGDNNYAPPPPRR